MSLDAVLSLASANCIAGVVTVSHGCTTKGASGLAVAARQKSLFKKATVAHLSHGSICNIEASSRWLVPKDLKK